MAGSDESETSYPRTATTRHGLTVDESIAPLVERVIDLGLTPRSSCSGLARDHAPETSPLAPYLSIQVAPTLETAQLTREFPDEARTAPLLARLQEVGDRAGWVVTTSLSWLLYPTATFRLTPSRRHLRNEMFGRDRDFDDLSDAEEARLDERYDAVQAKQEALSDADIDAKWEALHDELTTEFDEAETLPQFEDKQAAFEAAQEQWPEVFDALFDSDDELITFYDGE